MSTKFNIYYATTQDGPWILANAMPLDRVDGLQTYTITGLKSDTLYYVSIVGGTLDSQGNFVPLISQPLGPTTSGAADQSTRPVKPIGARTFSPKITTNNALEMQFTVV